MEPAADRRTETIRKRYDRIAGVYDRLERHMEGLFSRWRGQMLREAEGKVLEVGVGTGKNLSYYPAQVQVMAIDFSPRMLEAARKKLAQAGMAAVELRLMDAQSLEFPDDSFDTVVTSCVFCSVPDPVRGLREIRRVLKRDGKLLMLEHVRSGGRILGPLMDLLNPIPLHLYGANINRRTVENLRRAGFSDIRETDLWRDIVKKIVVINRK